MIKTPQVVAAVTAAIAEDLGTEVSAIRVITFRKIRRVRPMYVSRNGYKKYQLEDELA